MTRESLHRQIEVSTGNESNICQIYAIKDGKCIYEDNWRGFRTDDAAHVMSVTKGVMSLLTGIAMDKGFIHDTDQKVLDFFGGYQVKRGEKTIYDVTLKHLLTMTAPYKYRSEPWKKVCTSPDWTLAALDLLGGRSGITGEFKYANLGIQILTGIIENSSGMKGLDLANKYLFEPMDIPTHIDHGASDKDDQLNYVMSKSPRINEWYTDPKGSITAGWGLCISAKSLAKLGTLINNEGRYEGKKIISSDWINKMTTPYIQLGKMFGYMEYGYLWYKPFKDREVYAAIGDGGNIIYTNKEINVSVGVTSLLKPRIFDRVEFIEKSVLPTIL
ncbi:MAG: serine hydrolase [Clostridiales bacterium]|nr:serine hydrolase [Clostridiales bacterium]